MRNARLSMPIDWAVDFARAIERNALVSPTLQ
jgi:hypothetical protein